MGFLDDGFQKKKKNPLNSILRNAQNVEKKLKEFNKMKEMMKSMKCRESSVKVWER